MTHRIAIASSDGKNIDLHFARATQFYIFDVNDYTYNFVELRICETLIKHDVYEFDKAIEKFDDCLAIFVSTIGKIAFFFIISRGLRVFEAPYSIESVLTNLMRDKILNRIYEEQ